MVTVPKSMRRRDIEVLIRTSGRDAALDHVFKVYRTVQCSRSNYIRKVSDLEKENNKLREFIRELINGESNGVS